jgi:drug/metabolite transporter (DMT)-like permease
MALVLLKLAGETVSPLALNLFKNTLALVLLVATLLLLPGAFDGLRTCPPRDFWILSFSGVIGIGVADTLFLAALRRLGVGLISVVECTYCPFVLLFSAVLLAEPLTLSHYVGMSLIVGGVLIASRHPPPLGRTRREIIIGLLLGAGAMALMCFGIVLAKPALDDRGFPLIAGTTLRLAAGTLPLAVLAWASPKRREYFSVFKVKPNWKWMVPGSILGTYVAMIFWVAGFKYADAAVAGILNQTSIVFALILASVFLKEHLTRRKLLAIVLAASGVLIVTMRWFDDATLASGG